MATKTTELPSLEASKDWATALFTSEVGFLLHLPIWIKYDNSAHAPLGTLRNLIFILRIALHSIALPLLVWDARHHIWSWETFNSILYGSHSFLGWILMAVSAGLYLFTYLHHRLHYGLRKHIPVDPLLYAVAHVSILNYILDLPGRRIPTAKLTHVLIVATNIVAAIVLIFTLHTITPIQRAWGCYDPQFVDDLSDYDRGMCPADEDSNANICTERPFVNCEVDFGDNTFHKEIHYATQASMVALVLYALSIGDKLTFYKLEAYTE